MCVDEPRQCRHTLRIDRLTAATRGHARCNRHDAAAAHDDRPAIDDRAAADDNARVGDDEILGRRRNGAAERADEGESDEGEEPRHQMSSWGCRRIAAMTRRPTSTSAAWARARTAVRGARDSGAHAVAAMPRSAWRSWSGAAPCGATPRTSPRG